MPEVTIRLRINPETGKKDIIVSMRSDEDALPHEHEQQHKALADKLVNGGLVKAAELGKIIVEREEDEKEPAIPSGSTPQGERKAQQSGH
jgi:FtsH ternary system domain X3-analog